MDNSKFQDHDQSIDLENPRVVSKKSSIKHSRLGTLKRPISKLDDSDESEFDLAPEVKKLNISHGEPSKDSRSGEDY